MTLFGKVIPVTALTVRLALVTVVLASFTFYGWIRYHNYVADQSNAQKRAQSDAKAAAESGSDFVLEGGVPVSSQLIVPTPPPEVHRGDSYVIVYKLVAGRRGSGTATEAGSLRPLLTAADCAVTAQTPALTKSTKQPLAAFVWLWSIDDCKSTGFKAVQLVLACDGCDDPVADRELKFIHVTDPLSLTDVGAYLSVMSAALTIIAFVTNFFTSHRPTKDNATSESLIEGWT